MKVLFFFIPFLAFQKVNLNAASILNHIGDTAKLEEFYVDSLNIGRKKSNKIELSGYRTGDSSWVTIKFFSKSNGKNWTLRQTFGFEKNDIMSCDMKLSDFNNDGLKDMTYISAVAARGANEIRRLFIYDKIKDKLVYMKNSEDYPNMLYNKTLNCIDAFLVYGGSSTVFLRIKGDILVEFASVELDNDLRVYETDNKGARKLIRQDTSTNMYFVRFKNYKPLTPSENY